MYRKQDSIFWWELDGYVSKDEKYKNLSIASKYKIEESFRLAYYGLMQYELYKGRQLEAIELASVEQISHYISDNFDNLYNVFFKDHEDKKEFDFEEKEEFLSLLEDVVIPYINDHSFESVDDFRLTKENIQTLIMQLCIKNQYDINITDERNPERVFYSQIYPFMLTLMIVDPADPEHSYENVKNFFNPQTILEHSRNGRVLTEEEHKLVTPLIDLLNSEEDFKLFLLSFTSENWEGYDTNTRFKLVFQLSKFTAILLKDDIYNLTFLENESDLHDLIEYYLPIILRSESEAINYKENMQNYYFEKKLETKNRFLLPLSFKDFNPHIIEEYYQEKKITDVVFDLDKLYKMMDASLYVATYIRFLKLIAKDSQIFKTYFVNNKKVALVNSLKIFTWENEDHYEENLAYWFRLDELFLDANTLAKVETEPLESLVSLDDEPGQRMETILKMLSYVLALEPAKVKCFDYSLEEFIKYFLILFGPYKKSKLGYNNTDFALLTQRITEIVNHFSQQAMALKEDEAELITSGYYLHIYLIEKLLQFSKKPN